MLARFKAWFRGDDTPKNRGRRLFMGGVLAASVAITLPEAPQKPTFKVEPISPEHLRGAEYDIIQKITSQAIRDIQQMEDKRFLASLEVAA